MSNISTIIDTIRIAIPTLTGFSTKTEVPNPYSLVDNGVWFIKNGWGLLVGQSGQSPIDEFTLHTELRTFSIVLTKEVIRLDNDTDAVHTIGKALMEDAVLLAKDFLAFDQLGIDSSIQKVDFISNSGVEFVIGDKHNFMFTESAFNFHISESL